MRQKGAYTNTRFTHLAVSLFFMFAFGWICPTWGEVTRQGVQAIGIFIGGTWMIANRFGMIAPSLLIMFAMVLTGYSSGDEIVSSSLGSPIVWQLIAIFILVFAVSDTGADAVLARWMISRKTLNGHPALFATVFFLAVATMSALASGLGAFLFAMAMVDSIAKTAGFEDRSQWKKAMYLGSVVCASIGGAVIPFKGLPMMVYSLMDSGLSQAGIRIDQMSYMASAIFAVVLVAIVFGLSMGPLFKAYPERLKSIDIASIAAGRQAAFTKRQTCALGLFLLGFLYPIATMCLPSDIPGLEIFSSIGQGTWFALIGVIMFFVHIDGKPLLEIDKAVGSAVQWGIIFAVCAFTSIGGMIADESLGVQGWLSDIMGAALGSMPFPVFIVCLVLFTLVLTNVFSNTATAVIVGTIIGPQLITYSLQLGINVSCIIPGIVVSACAAFLTMAAGGMAPVFLGSDAMKDSQRWVFTWGLLAIPIITVASSVVYLATSYLL